MYVSVIVPVYNETKIIKDSITKLDSYLDNNFEKYEIIVVDDGSTDNTINSIAQENIIIISMGKNKGKGAAVCEGMKYAEGDYAFFIDGDLPYPLSFVDENIHLLSAYNIVVGKRDGKYPFIRRMGSSVYNLLVSNLFHIEVTDVQCGIKGFDKTAYKSLFPVCQTEGFAFDTEILLRAKRKGFKVVECPAHLTHRKDSKLKIKHTLKMLYDIAKMKRIRI